jgi:hypothetical protein
MEFDGDRPLSPTESEIGEWVAEQDMREYEEYQEHQRFVDESFDWSMAYGRDLSRVQDELDKIQDASGIGSGARDVRKLRKLVSDLVYVLEFRPKSKPLAEQWAAAHAAIELAVYRLIQASNVVANYGRCSVHQLPSRSDLDVKLDVGWFPEAWC